MSNNQVRKTKPRVWFPPFRPDLNVKVRFRLRFPLDDFDGRKTDMEPYLTGTHHISLKQVPSVLTLRRAGSGTVYSCKPYLLDAGFCIEEILSNGERHFIRKEKGKEMPISDPYRPSANLAELLMDDSFTTTTQSDERIPQPEPGWEQAEGNRRKVKYRKVVYEDFFRIVSGRFLADHQRRSNPPRVIVWYGDVQRLQDPVRPDLFRWNKFGRVAPKNPIRFQDVTSWEVKLDFIMRHTHWGAKLRMLCKEEEMIEKDPLLLRESGCKVAPTTARTLKSVIRAFLKGDPDPRWTSKMKENLYHKERQPVNRDARSRRFLEMLKTVDGVFAQRFSAFPHEEWTYEKYDLFVLGLIWELISDEFLDGKLSDEGKLLTTRFSELKSSRGEFKHCAGMASTAAMGSLPFFRKEGRWLRKYLLPLYEEYDTIRDDVDKNYVHGVLCQTRCAGKPPPLAKLQTKIKFLETVQLPDDTNPVKTRIVATAMEELVRDLPDEAFTGLSTKAGISATSSACWEYTQSEEGTLHALQDICKDRVDGVKAMVFDLDTGEPSHYLGDEESEGTYIFWRCFEEVIHMKPEERKKASLVVIDEPGKNRSVTKAVACVKVVFDFVNKICSVPLEKGFESSHSGMRKANHMWNFFKDFEKEPLRSVLFSVDTRKEAKYNGYTRVYQEYHDVFAVSTDYETATDYLSHKIGRVIAYPWMVKCGIPKILRDLVCEIAFQPRPIYFSGDPEIGELVDTVDGVPRRRIFTRRGVLMGDPLTKVVLHFTNIVSRRLSWRIYQEDFLQKVLKSNRGFEYLKAMLRRFGVSLSTPH